MMFPSYALFSGIALYASAASAATWLVDVSNATAGLEFGPNNITAGVGDSITFRYNPKNHSVTQSSFADPCSFLSGGFNLGFVPVANGTDTSSLPTRQIIVNDTKPIWVYCAQAANTPESHCGKGMVFAINAGPEGSNNSFSLYQGKALAIGAALRANATNTTSTTATTTAGTYGTSSKPSSTGLGGSSSNGAISMNIDGANAMLMAGLGMVIGLMV